MTRKINIFVVDDEMNFRELMVDILPETKYALEVFADGYAALEAVKKKDFDVGLIDVTMPKIDGIELLKRLIKISPLTEYIMLTGNATISSAVEAIKLGAANYLTKPIQMATLEIIIEKAYENSIINKENIILKEELRSKDIPPEIIGKSSPLKEVFTLINKVAKTSSQVLITGESGVGKELAAKAIHKNSSRSDKPFVIIDCTSIPTTLLESELFGHEKGSFTHAISQKLGLFEIANTGTIFIDEIGEMELNTQAKLLRAIETHQFRRIGGTKQIEVDVRIIAATNRNLTEEISKSNFRKDLYYRLNVINIHVPPLRERKDDIPLLANHFAANNSVKIAHKKITPEAMKIIKEYNWPGNIRELANVIERALIISESDYITPADLPFNLSDKNNLLSDKNNVADLLKEYEKNIIIKTIAKCGGNMTRAAELLKYSRANFYRKLTKYKINS